MQIRKLTHILAFVLAASLGAFACGDDEDKDKGGTQCEAPQTLCGDVCVDTDTNDAHCGGCNTACSATETCEEGVCVEGTPAECTEATAEDDCDEGQICVDGVCTDETPVPACTEDTDCDDGQTCVEGVCTDETPGLECEEIETECDVDGEAVCVDTATDVAHCGACNSPCEDGESCVEGACEPEISI